MVFEACIFTLTANFAGSLEHSLWFLHKYVNDAAEDLEALDQILVPMIEHVIRFCCSFSYLKHGVYLLLLLLFLKKFCLKQTLRFKESKNGGQALILVNWLFQDELLFQSLATNLANIVVRKDDSYIALAWCVLIRNLLECESSISQYSMSGKTPISLFLFFLNVLFASINPGPC